MDLLTSALKKIDNFAGPTYNRAALAFSGGVDSALCVELLRRIYKVKEIIAITVDVGQGDGEVKTCIDVATKLGIKPIAINAKDIFSKEWLTKAIQANSSYNGYPVSTSMTRQLIAQKVAIKAKELGCDVLVEGSTGKGNDQYRMHNVFSYFAPKIDVLAPIRDFDLSRHEELALCKAWDIPVHEQIVGGDDKTLWCRSIASGAIGLNQKISSDVWMWLKQDEKMVQDGKEVVITFDKGIPVALDDKKLPLVDIINQLNVLGGACGIGIIDIIEDGIMGLKSHELYEAPAATIILTAKKDLEQLCLTKEEIQYKKNIDATWAYLVYHGMWFHPLKQALDAFIEKTQEVLCGVYKIKLNKGVISIVERTSSYSLFFPHIRSITSDAFNQKQCKDAAKIIGLPFDVLALRSKNNESCL